MQNPLTHADLTIFNAEISEAEATAMIASVWARTVQKIAPCLKDLDANEEQVEFVKGILRGVVLRWYDTGSGAVMSRTAGEYQEQLSKYSGGTFRPEELEDLQSVCGASDAPKASTILTFPWELDAPDGPHPFTIA